MSAPEVRRLARDETAAATSLLHPEGWAFEAHELARLHHLGGAVGAFEGGRLVGFLSFVDMPPLRWVGNVAVDPALRGQGLGQRLVEEALRDAPNVALYAVEKAVTLYERLGFRALGDAWALRASDARPRRPVAVERLPREAVLDAARFDRHETGMDRGFVLRALVDAYPDHAFAVRERGVLMGYGIAKPSPGLTELGPVVAAHPRAGEDLLDALLAATSGPHEATALAANARALAALEARGFTRSFRTVLMARGEPPRWRAASLYAAAGLEKG